MKASGATSAVAAAGGDEWLLDGIAAGGGECLLVVVAVAGGGEWLMGAIAVGGGDWLLVVVAAAAGGEWLLVRSGEEV